ncbi:hypothetical protein GCM10009660_58340 [Catellatospora bangladeshensis]
MEGGFGTRRSKRWLRRFAPWVLLAGFAYLYLAICVSGGNAGPAGVAQVVPAAVSAPAATPPPADHHHGDDDGGGVLIHHPECSVFLGSELPAGVDLLLALGFLLSFGAFGEARHRVARGAGGTRPRSTGLSGGRVILLSLCVART